MILEHAILPVRPGSESDFEEAFRMARPLISQQPGFRSLSISRSIETPNLYLLLVEWESVETHTDGFRGSATHEGWKELLHHFYDPFPVVEHFTTVRWPILHRAAQLKRGPKAMASRSWAVTVAP